METTHRNTLGNLLLAALMAAAGFTKILSAQMVQPEPGERHFARIRQLTFEGNNAESYFSRNGKMLIFQRQEVVDQGCDQEYIINIDGTGLRRISNGWGRTTCGYFFANDQRVLYS